jgi:hypothetical protein
VLPCSVLPCCRVAGGRGRGDCCFGFTAGLNGSRGRVVATVIGCQSWNVRPGDGGAGVGGVSGLDPALPHGLGAEITDPEDHDGSPEREQHQHPTADRYTDARLKIDRHEFNR